MFRGRVEYGGHAMIAFLAWVPPLTPREGAAAVALIHQHLAADGAVPTFKGERPVGDVS